MLNHFLELGGGKEDLHKLHRLVVACCKERNRAISGRPQGPRTARQALPISGCIPAPRDRARPLARLRQA